MVLDYILLDPRAILFAVFPLSFKMIIHCDLLRTKAFLVYPVDECRPLCTD